MHNNRDDIELEILKNKLDEFINVKDYRKATSVINRIGNLCQNNSQIKEQWKIEYEQNKVYRKLIRRQLLLNSIPKFISKMYIKYRKSIARRRMHIKYGLKKPSINRFVNSIKKIIEWVWSWTSYPSWEKYFRNYNYSKEVPSEKNIKNSSTSLKMAVFDTFMTGIFAYLTYDYIRDIKVDIEDMRLLGLTGTALTRGIVHRITLGFLAKAGAMTAVNTIVDNEMDAERIEKERMKELEILNSYISPKLLDKIRRNENKEVEATIVFTDVRGYTSMSTEMEAIQMVKLLSLHYNLINKIVDDYEGVMLKYIGDSAMFAFNLHEQKNSVDLAISSCIDIQRGMLNLNEFFKEKYNYELPVGIGIATGKVMLTSIGGNFKDFTLIGDAVNLAARLNGVAKEKEIIIDLNTKERSQMMLDARKWGLDLRRKGKIIEYEFQNLGKMNLKGKGEIETHKVLFNIK